MGRSFHLIPIAGLVQHPGNAACGKRPVARLRLGAGWLRTAECNGLSYLRMSAPPSDVLLAMNASIASSRSDSKVGISKFANVSR